jgi:hypothetical protein
MGWTVQFSQIQAHIVGATTKPGTSRSGVG